MIFRLMISAAIRVSITALLWRGEIASAAPVVIFKLDDMRAAQTATGFSTNWQRVFDYVETKSLPISVGIIGDSLDNPGQAYVENIRRLRNTGLVEFWNHGYLHVRNQPPGTAEFNGTSLEYQRTNFETVQGLFRDRLGFSAAAFGAPYNQADANTRKVLEADADMQIIFYGQAAFFAPGKSRLLNLENWLRLEISAGNLSYDTFVADYPAQRHRPYLALQGHPGGWDSTEFAAFTKIVDFLAADGATFATPSGYRARMDGDGDGVPDVIEKILGRDPALAEPAPALSLDLHVGFLRFEIAASQPAKPRVIVESSGNLANWSQVSIAAEWISTLPDGRRQVEIPVSSGSQPRFWRLAEGAAGVSAWP